MNIILFEPEETGRPLSRRDERTAHLLKVLRKKPGDTFDAGVLGGQMGTGRIESLRLDGSLVFSLDLRSSPPERAPLRVGVGFPRPIQLRRILRDLSCMGVSALDLFGTELGEKSYQDSKLLSGGGARAALVEGAVQSRDTSLPELHFFPAFAGWLAERPWNRGGPAPGSLLVAADNVRPEGTFAHLGFHRRPVVLAVGSERGWSDGERDLLERAGFVRLSLGRRALRTETACVAAATLVLEKIGELE